MDNQCVVCGKGLHPVDPGVHTVGFTASGPLYVHAGDCSEQMVEGWVATVTCRGCGRSFDTRKGKPGRPREFHSVECREGHRRRVDAIWRDAARGVLPATLDECIQRRNALTALVADVREGHFNGQTVVADGVLASYARRLSGEITRLETEQRRSAEQAWAEQTQRWVRDRQQAAADQVEAFYASIGRHE